MDLFVSVWGKLFILLTLPPPIYWTGLSGGWYVVMVSCQRRDETCQELTLNPQDLGTQVSCGTKMVSTVDLLYEVNRFEDEEVICHYGRDRRDGSISYTFSWIFYPSPEMTTFRRFLDICLWISMTSVRFKFRKAFVPTETVTFLNEGVLV